MSGKIKERIVEWAPYMLGLSLWVVFYACMFLAGIAVGRLISRLFF